jgi:hypothetical protein
MANGVIPTITIRAKGEPANGDWPEMRLRINGAEVMIVKVTNLQYADFSYAPSQSISYPAKIDVVFTNDYHVSSLEDRNLYVDYIKIGTRIFQANDSSYAIYDRGYPWNWQTTAFDGLDVIAARKDLLWTGALRFTIPAPPSPTPMPSPSPKPTATPSIKPTPTSTPKPTPTSIVTPTATIRPTSTPIMTPTVTLTPTSTPKPTPTLSPTLTPTVTPSTTPVKTLITIRAYGSSAFGEWSQMIIFINGSRMQTWTVNNSSYADFTYEYPNSLINGTKIDVVFPNDACNAPYEDRNLYVDYIKIDNNIIQAEATQVTYDRGVPWDWLVTSFDGQDVIPGREDMLWTGALRFVFTRPKPTLTPTISPTPTPTVRPKKVLAFYYGWFCKPEYGCWNAIPTGEDPNLGRYESTDSNIIDAHIREAKKYGIDGFIISWLGHYPNNSANDKPDVVIKSLLAKAGEVGNFYIAIDFEPLLIKNAFPSTFETEIKIQMKYAVDTYGSNPNYFKINNKPVIFFWKNEEFATQLWKDTRTFINSQAYWIAEAGPHKEGIYTTQDGTFDDCHYYSTWWTGALEQQEIMWNMLPNRPKFSTVAPGFRSTPYGRWVDGKVDTYRTQWEFALGKQPDYVLITSYNEWPEGTYLEGSTKWGFDYLNLTKQYVETYKQH